MEKKLKVVFYKGMLLKELSDEDFKEDLPAFINFTKSDERVMMPLGEYFEVKNIFYKEEERRASKVNRQ